MEVPRAGGRRSDPPGWVEPGRIAETRETRRYERLKLVVDRTVALVGLLLLLPVFALIALAVKLDSPGPVFFRQKRVGRGGELFTLVKFRTMYHDCEPYAVSPAGDDAGITRLGRVLRDRALDELPQLWCVVKGQMSLVGPRPEMPFIVREYSERERVRLSVLPGLTGYWQLAVSRRHEPIHANLEYDLFYIRHRCFRLDLWILTQTLKIPLGLRPEVRPPLRERGVQASLEDTLDSA